MYVRAYVRSIYENVFFTEVKRTKAEIFELKKRSIAAESFVHSRCVCTYIRTYAVFTKNVFFTE